MVAVDNEQYREWVRARWSVELEGGEGFHAIAALLASRVEYLRLDAFDLDLLDERFDVILCFGLLHRVKSPLDLLGVLRRRVSPGGSVLLETYGVREPGLENEAGVRTWAAERSMRTTISSIGASAARAWRAWLAAPASPASR